MRKLSTSLDATCRPQRELAVQFTKRSERLTCNITQLIDWRMPLVITDCPWGTQSRLSTNAPIWISQATQIDQNVLAKPDGWIEEKRLHGDYKVEPFRRKTLSLGGRRRTARAAQSAEG